MVNSVTLVGRVGKDPEMRKFDGDSQVITFSLATSETYRNKAGEKVENTEWHNVVIWNKLAGIVEQYVKKGDLIYLEGKIKTRSYDDNDGNKKYMTEIVCHNMKMLGGKSDQEQQNKSNIAPAGNPNYKGDNDFDRMMDEQEHPPL